MVGDEHGNRMPEGGQASPKGTVRHVRVYDIYVLGLNDRIEVFEYTPYFFQAVRVVTRHKDRNRLFIKILFERAAAFPGAHDVTVGGILIPGRQIIDYLLGAIPVQIMN